MSRPRFTALVESLPSFVPFVGPEEQERARGQPFRARLGANESLFGPSPKALAAMRAAADGNWMYADPESHELRATLAASFSREAVRRTAAHGTAATPLDLAYAVCWLELDPKRPRSIPAWTSWLPAEPG